jgi:hypothetical protein
MSRRLVRRVARTEPVRNSGAGNTTYRVHFTDGSSYLTETNAAIGGVIENSKYRQADYTYTVTSRKRLTKVSHEPTSERPIQDRAVYLPEEV